MLTIQDFDVSPEIAGIFTDRMILDLEDIVYTLELYKFKSRESILGVLNNCSTLLKELSAKYFLDSYKTSISSVQTITRSSEFKEIEERESILINKLGNDSIEIITSFSNTFNLAAVELALDFRNISIVFITPYNFDWILGNQLKYDVSILFRRFVLECIWRKATDIHFTVEHVQKVPKYNVYYRKDGLLHPLKLFELTKELNEGMLRNTVEQMSNRDAVDLTISKGITALIPNVFADNNVELRLAANRVKDGYDYVCRLQRSATVALHINELGFPDDVQRVLIKTSKKRAGITLITGPIRTGKNTTAFAIANEMVKYPIKIKSIESPIEALMPFPQVDYNDDAEALKDAVRLSKKQDINVVLLNEIPTSEVAFAVKDLVNSSVHVITTMHVDRIWHLPYKLREYYGDSYRDIISQINVVFNQKMFPVVCPYCVERSLVDDLADEDYKSFLRNYGVKTIGVSRGCQHCLDLDTGTIGNVIGKNQPYVEYLVFNDYVKSELLKCEFPYQMEDIIKNIMFKNKSSLEFSLSKAISDNVLHVDALDSIL